MDPTLRTSYPALAQDELFGRQGRGGLISLLSGGSPDDPTFTSADEVTEWFESVAA